MKRNKKFDYTAYDLRGGILNDPVLGPIFGIGFVVLLAIVFSTLLGASISEWLQ